MIDWRSLLCIEKKEVYAELRRLFDAITDLSKRNIKGKVSLTGGYRSFQPILDLIRQARARSFRAVNTELISLYWNIGKFISLKIQSDGWGKSTVQSLSAFIHRKEPHATGFSAQNLWRMRQFYAEYNGRKKLSALLRELSWTHNLLILGKCPSADEREFYIRREIKELY